MLTKLRAVLLVSGLAVLAGDARAAWPPTEDMTKDDLADPANWPNDEDYAYSPEQNGQWQFYSFIPEQETPGLLRPEETAAGMSIDLAWRYGIGDPRVVIMVTDSGIRWSERDLIEKIALNHRELVGHEPTHADGSPCTGGPETPAELAVFDCNGDGVLSVGDYADTTPPEGKPQDRNGNGRFDAGDLILAYSDGEDDDDNGYVDDIAGWDFMKNDNDPFDETDYGHGTGEARWAAAEANNGIGQAGVCPRCRILPARVGDSFVADTNDFAKALVYAADNGVSVVNAALGGIDMTRFAQRALDYAFEKGVLVVNAMADENARHHNFPATANHTLPVHAITIGGNRTTSATTFLAFNTCTNFGGQNLLSVSGEGCSSEATARLSGIAGLLYSAALRYGVTLSPAEVQELLITTADDIDVPESREPGSVFYPSQPGFDQRFGYGRVNANTAVERIKDGKIPPAIDIVHPRWFTILSRKGGPVELRGTVSAKRAVSFDVIVEWAPGVEPLDEAFQILKSYENVPADTVLGGDEPLATIDPSEIDTTHEPDLDSPHGENAHTITVRVRAVSHYGGARGDVAGIMHRTLAVHDDPDLLAGFPLDLGESGEASPKLSDIDGDGVRDLVYPTSGGALHVWRIGPEGPEELPGFPYRSHVVDGLREPAPTPGTPVYLAAPGYASGAIDVDIAREAFTNAPAIGDLDGDGRPEIVASTFAGTVHVVTSEGEPLPGWPKRLPDVPSCPVDVTAPPPSGPCMSVQGLLARGAFAAPVLVDLDGDDRLDIVQAAFDGFVYAWNAEGEALPGWPVEIHYTGPLSDEPPRNRILSTPAVADFDGDGTPDLLLGSNEGLGSAGFAGAIYLVSGRGNQAPTSPILPGWPVTLTSLEIFPLISQGVPTSGAVGRFDGTLAAVIHGNGSLPVVLPADPGAQDAIGATPSNAIPERPDPYAPGGVTRGLDLSSNFGPRSKAAQPDTMLPLFAQPALGDMDQDGTPDIVTSGGSLSMALTLGAQGSGKSSAVSGQLLLSMWSGKTGVMLPASPIVLEEFTFLNNAAIADLTGDGYPEAIVGTGGYFVRAVDACGREAPGFPKFTNQWILTSVALGDLDGDHRLEVVTGTRNGWLYAWRTQAPDTTLVEWESYHHDERNTGSLETPLSQGTPGKRAAVPLTPATCDAPPPPEAFRATGGCGPCSAAGAPEDDHRAIAWLLVAGIVCASSRRKNLKCSSRARPARRRRISGGLEAGPPQRRTSVSAPIRASSSSAQRPSRRRPAIA